jgi:hypothetical protein
MSMQTDVKSGAAGAGATTTIFDGPARIKGVTISYSTGATVVLNDGTDGTAMLSFTAPAAAGSINIVVPGEGIKCSTNISAVVSATTTAVVFYG